MEWLDTAHPDYVDRLAKLASEKRIEIIGGPFYEPILAMLPSRDRIGQILRYSDWIKSRLGATVQGIWTPERVWEQSYVRDLAEAGIKYTILDDFHFKNSGLNDSQLWKHYITEDDGKTMFVFPGCERLRYLIPFRNIEESIEYFALQSELNKDAVLIHGDDGEKFGCWPDTFESVFDQRWLHRFFQALSDNSNWLVTTTPTEVIENLSPLGKIYLPDASYREMTEWVLPPESQLELARLNKEMQEDERFNSVRIFIRGGFWRNFKVRYPESNEMYAKMMNVSEKIEKLATDHPNEHELVEETRRLLYRAQCNCGYWHGAFGGVYLPHLRNSVFHELIEAEKKLELYEYSNNSWVETEIGDFDFDSKNEIKLANEKLAAWIAPSRGGIMYELDVKSISHNLLASMTRRPEPYHGLVHRAASEGGNEERIVLKQEGLDRLIQHDWYQRKSLVDLFYDADLDFSTLRSGDARQHGSFVLGNYESVVRKKPGRIQILMTGEGTAYGAPIRIRKGITLSAESNVLEIAYRLENLPKDYRMHFAIEFNFAGMPGGAENRYFQTSRGEILGNLSTNLDLYGAGNLELIDEWLQLRVGLSISRPSGIYAFPIETVSQSVEGFESVHQSVCVQPHWILEPDQDGCWSVEIGLSAGNF